ncbi:MAG TPA: sigma-70 family RNA polymerase sigma factor [Cyclobacteriaceae bacterium]|nr:sigma-70 family RNA polymerase sigma factor [Cyclobacteriaceae bacterium]
MISHLFRREAGKMASVLTRLLGPDQLDAAQDIVQDALLKAMEVWPFHGIPENPSAWLYKVAKNKAIDYLRSNQTKTKILAELQNELKSGWGMSSRMNQLFKDEEIQDSVLRMMFVCCHPSIPQESQIALTLKTLGGLTSLEIGHAFLTSEETITKRIFRAKEKIKEERLSVEVPVKAELIVRMDSVLKVLYLLFNEGYNSSHPDILVREELCEEAMRLCYLLIQNKETNLPKVRALIALMCLQAARFPSRVNEAGAKILLQDQDRSKWNKALIQQGLNFLRDAFSGDQLTEYHVEAAIASVHSVAADFSNTNWTELLKLYETLYEMKPSPMVELNKAIALGYARTPQEGIEALEKIIGLEDHYLYLASLGNFHVMRGDKILARKLFGEAMTRTASKTEIELLKRKIDACSN